MLDWQNKKWIKVIAVILVVTFVSYDIAWAVDFSPTPLTKAVPHFIPKILDFMSQRLLRHFVPRNDKRGISRNDEKILYIPLHKFYSKKRNLLKTVALRVRGNLTPSSPPNSPKANLILRLRLNKEQSKDLAKGEFDPEDTTNRSI